MFRNACVSEDKYLCYKNSFLSYRKHLAVCFAPANGAAPSFMLEVTDALFAWWFFGTTTAARWVLLFCLSGLPPALSAEPHLLFEVVLFVVSCPFKAAAAAGRV